MFLALSFGLFLTAPLVLLVMSVVRTAVGVSRGKQTTAARPAVRTKHTDVRPPVAAATVTRKDSAPAATATPRFGRRTGTAHAGEQRRDFFGDVVVAKRPVKAAPRATTNQTASPAAPTAAKPHESAPNGTLLEFPMREAQLARLRQQYARRA